MESLITPSLIKEILLQCGLAGLLIISACWGFRIIMQYIERKDKRHADYCEARDKQHAAAWELRETRFLKELEAWRGSVATALNNNTKTMSGLQRVMQNNESQAALRHLNGERNFDLILKALEIEKN